jgi:dTMP kinase
MPQCYSGGRVGKEIWHRHQPPTEWLRMSGALVAFEGIDQAGKLTQAQALHDRAVQAGLGCALLHYPDYSTPIGRLLRQVLTEGLPLDPRARTMLFAANRWERDAEMRRLLDANDLVLVDRYSASNIVYGMSQGYDTTWLRALENGLRPADLTLFIDISPDESLRRKSASRDEFERNLELLARARDGYRQMARAENWLVVDGAGAAADVSQRIVRGVHARLQPRIPGLDRLLR